VSWFDDFKAADGGEPTDGTHTARLENGAVITGKDGRQWIKLTWQTVDNMYWWEGVHGVTGGAKQFTKGLLSGLGINLADIGSEDELVDRLVRCEGAVYTVGVQRNGEYLNTTVLSAGSEPQPELPIDTAGLPEPGASASSMFDDDIAF
jgi:hypothetical protein